MQFKLKAPSAAFLASLAMVWNGVVSDPTRRRNMARNSATIRSAPGRSSSASGARATRSRWMPILITGRASRRSTHLVFKEYPDSQAALLALKRGETQIMGDVATPGDRRRCAATANLVLTQPGLTVNGMAMPNDTPPFTDKRVRQALNYAVDKDGDQQGAVCGLAVTMTSPLPEAQWGFDKSLKGYPTIRRRQGAARGGRREARMKVELLSLQHAARLQSRRA